MILSFEFTLVTWQLRAQNRLNLYIIYFSISSRTAAGNRAYTRMTYANYSSFPGFRWGQKYCL